MQTIRCVVVGDEGVGKVCLLTSYTSNEFPSENAPKSFVDFSTTVQRDGEEYNLALINTTGWEEYEGLRQLSYSKSDVILICFSVALPSSFENVKQKWIPEIRNHCHNIPFLIVGTKMDLRDDPTTIEKLKIIKEKPITAEMGEKLAKELKAVKYVECSALTRIGLQNVFNEVMSAALQPQKRQKCSIL